MNNRDLVIRELDEKTVGISTNGGDPFITGSALVGWSEFDEGFYWEANGRSHYGNPRPEYQERGSATTREAGITAAQRALRVMQEAVEHDLEEAERDYLHEQSRNHLQGT